MKFTKTKSAVLCALAALLLNTTVPLGAGAHDTEAAKSSVIRIAPAAPVFDEKTRHTELAGRRARVGQSIGARGSSHSLQHRAARLHERRRLSNIVRRTISTT